MFIMNTTAVITTIQSPTESSTDMSQVLAKHRCRLVVVGDRKGPDGYSLPNTTFLGIQDQLDGPFALAKALPEGHYARKNIGYLEAMRQGATCIYETDDDNAPLPHWRPREEQLTEARVVPNDQWQDSNQPPTPISAIPQSRTLEYILSATYAV